MSEVEELNRVSVRYRARRGSVAALDDGLVRGAFGSRGSPQGALPRHGPASRGFKKGRTGGSAD